MFMSIYLLGVLAMGVVAAPTAGQDDASSKLEATYARAPMLTQFQRFITPKIRRRPAAPPCGFGQC